MAIAAPHRVFLARFAGTSVFEPNGDRVGKIRDVVALLRSGNQSPRVVGIVVEVPPKRRIFIPITRISSIDLGVVVITGQLNIRRFEPRTNEIQVISELLDKSVHHHHAEYSIDDVAMESDAKGDWYLNQLHLLPKSRVRKLRTHSKTVGWSEVQGVTTIEENQGVATLLATISTMRAADLAGMVIDLTPKRRTELLKALDDERLASVLEEMDESLRVEILAEMEGERAADVLGEMGADDAADLLRDLGSDRASALLELMEPEDAADVRRLMSYEDYSAGGMMTTEPVILGADATVADALDAIRRSELPPSLASAVYIVRPPIETPTGRFIGTVHLQRLLRERPGTLLGGIIDTETTPISPEWQLAETASYLANYNLLSVPIVDENHRLLGAVAIDDLLDHLLPQDWRKKASEMLEVPHES
jgi:flagellar motility protein MotE (MotC chaperone)/sporulation protein YlmC with PRC-barrel domain